MNSFFCIHTGRFCDILKNKISLIQIYFGIRQCTGEDNILKSVIIQISNTYSATIKNIWIKKCIG